MKPRLNGTGWKALLESYTDSGKLFEN